MVSHPSSRVHVSLAVLCGVSSIILAAFLYSMFSFSVYFLHASGTYDPSVPYPSTLNTQALTMLDFSVMRMLGNLFSAASVIYNFYFPFLFSLPCVLSLSYGSLG